MYGDTAHKKLLDAGWRWNGVWYATTSHLYLPDEIKHEVSLELSPIANPHGAIVLCRKGQWEYRMNGKWLARFSNLNDAAKAVKGA